MDVSLSVLKQVLFIQYRTLTAYAGSFSIAVSYLVAFSPMDDIFHRAVHFLPLCFQ